MDKIQITDITESLIPLVASTEAACFSDASGEDALKVLFSMKAYGVAAICNNNICGFAYASDCAGDAELLRICVLPEYRRTGLGRKLLATLHKKLTDNGCGCVFLEVRESNAGAIALYTSDGYLQTGKRKGFYKYPHEDALLFTKIL